MASSYYYQKMIDNNLFVYNKINNVKNYVYNFVLRDEIKCRKYLINDCHALFHVCYA